MDHFLNLSCHVSDHASTLTGDESGQLIWLEHTGTLIMQLFTINTTLFHIQIKPGWEEASICYGEGEQH